MNLLALRLRNIKPKLKPGTDERLRYALTDLAKLAVRYDGRTLDIYVLWLPETTPNLLHLEAAGVPYGFLEHAYEREGMALLQAMEGTITAAINGVFGKRRKFQAATILPDMTQVGTLMRSRSGWGSHAARMIEYCRRLDAMLPRKGPARVEPQRDGAISEPVEEDHLEAAREGPISEAEAGAVGSADDPPLEEQVGQ